jgi:hypothetical protein
MCIDVQFALHTPLLLQTVRASSWIASIRHYHAPPNPVSYAGLTR